MLGIRWRGYVTGWGPMDIVFEWDKFWWKNGV